MFVQNRRKLIQNGLGFIAAGAVLGSVKPALAAAEPDSLAAKVAAGELPPLAERLPKNPLVWASNEWNPEVGKYGGDLKIASSYATVVLSTVGLTRVTADRTAQVPYLAESFEWNDDFTAITFHLREGVKWSDGHPFTTEDIMFWWEDVVHSEYLDKPLPVFGFNVNSDKLVAVDAYTLRAEFTKPNATFLFATRGFSDGETGFLFRAKHYWSQFHPKYATLEGDPKQIFRELLDTMQALPPAQWRLDAANVPVLYPWKAVRYEQDVRIEMERNPYYWVVDEAGNQLPYIDTVTSYFMNEANPEQIKLRILAGEIDLEYRIGVVKDVPLYYEAADSAKIRVAFSRQVYGSMQGIYFGYNHPDLAKRELCRNVDFRRAMSLAINRSLLNETAALGLGKVGSGYSNVGEYDPQIDAQYIEYDPDRANALLDSVGLDKRDAEGYRTLPDGSPLAWTLAYTPGWLDGGLDTVEVTSECWRDVGIRTNVLATLNPVRVERENRGDLDTWIRPGTGGLPTYGHRSGYGVVNWAKVQLAEWQANESQGTAFTDVDPTMKALLDASFAQARAVPFGEEFERQNDIYRKIMSENLYVVGLIQDVPKVWLFKQNLGNAPGAATPEEGTMPLGTNDEEWWMHALYFA